LENLATTLPIRTSAAFPLPRPREPPSGARLPVTPGVRQVYQGAGDQGRIVQRDLREYSDPFKVAACADDS